MAFSGVQPAVDVVAPPYGLASVATVINHGASDGHWGMGFEQENGLCGIHGTTWELCHQGAISDLSGPHTDFDRYGKVFPFVVVAEDECKIVLSAKRDESRQRLLKILDVLSVKGAERELWSGPTVSVEHPTDARYLRDGNATMLIGGSPSKALAEVEDALAECLPGVNGTIHMTPGVAAYLGPGLQVVDGQLRTSAGSWVAVGAGYAGEGTPAIYGTGPVIVHLGKSEMVTDDLEEMSDTKTNEVLLRAERPVAVAFDGCCQVGAPVTYP